MTFNRFVLNMVKCHHLHLRCHSPLFCNYKQFDINTATAHHPVIQKEVDEILVKCAIESSTGDAGFTQRYLWFLSTHVVYDLFLNLQQFNH